MPTPEQIERRQAPRYSFVATVEVSEVESRKRLIAMVKDVSRFGCYLETPDCLPVGAQIRLEITHRDASLRVLGMVVHSAPNAGMGILFTHIEPSHEVILEKWLAELSQSEPS